VSMAVLWYLTRDAPRHAVTRRPGPSATPAPVAVPMGVDRRRFVTDAIGIGSAAVIVGGVGRLLQQRHAVSGEIGTITLPRPQSPAGPLPADVQLPLDGLEPFVTPNDAFYRIDTALVVPQVSKDDWNLRIHGMVDRELVLTYDDVLARSQVERYITLSCVSNPVGGDLVGNARWQGVPLKDLLDDAGVHPEATQVVSRSSDGWTAGSPTELVMDGRDAMLAIAMNGEPLPARHGYPARLVVPGLYGYVSATKWVTSIELTRWEDYDAYWIPRGWSKSGPVKTMARIDTHRPGERAGEVVVGGVAWAVHRGISAVQVRVDEGEWLDAELGGVPSDDTWVQWRATVSGQPGRHRVDARAVDGTGQPQPEETAAVAPNGAQGYPMRWFDI
jgi:DMSO/TMAO reductase YedYZ molybdopterin-dependent catalytic subunit